MDLPQAAGPILEGFFQNLKKKLDKDVLFLIIHFMVIVSVPFCSESPS